MTFRLRLTSKYYLPVSQLVTASVAEWLPSTAIPNRIVLL